MKNEIKKCGDHISSSGGGGWGRLAVDDGTDRRAIAPRP